MKMPNTTFDHNSIQMLHLRSCLKPDYGELMIIVEVKRPKFFPS